jgi:hypothetical protein
MTTLKQSADRIMRHLDDETGDVWTREQIENFIADGYDKICREAQPLFDMIMFDRQPYTGNYTRPFERDYMDGWPILRQFNFTKESDREYLPPADYPVPGPANHTAPYEAEYFADGGSQNVLASDTATTTTTWKMPEGFTSVERVTHDWLQLKPELARYLRQTRNTYQTEQGGVFSYSMDQDGLFEFRTVGVPVRTIEPEEISGIYGGLRRITSYSYDQEVLIGSYGGIRSLPQHFMASSQEYGGMKRITPDTNATRVEFFRLGKDLAKHPFELPGRMVRYVEWWALYRAYSTPGEGEDALLAEHYKTRYEAGRDRVKNRVKDVSKERIRGMGSRRLGARDNYLERFPSDYGYKRPFRG